MSQAVIPECSFQPPNPFPQAPGDSSLWQRKKGKRQISYISAISVLLKNNGDNV